MLIDQRRPDLVVHPNKGGYIFVYDSRTARSRSGRWSRTSTSSRISTKTGKLIGRRDIAGGEHTNLCPAIPGGICWNSGGYNPQTGLYYKVGQEWCMDLEIVKTTPILEPMAQLNMARTSSSPIRTAAKRTVM